MLTSLTEGKRVHAENMTDRTKKYVCHICKEEMILIKPTTDIIDHFRHKTSSEIFHGEPETKEHLTGKKFLYDYFKEYDPKLEYILPNGQIADVYLTALNVSIEFQCSKISTKEFNERNKGYREMDIPVLWILGTRNYLKSYKSTVWNEDRLIRTKTIERNLSSLYDRVYYLSIYPVQIPGIFLNDKLNFLDVEFSYWSKTISSIINLKDINEEYIKTKIIIKEGETPLEGFVTLLNDREVKPPIRLSWEDLTVIPECFTYFDTCHKKYMDDLKLTEETFNFMKDFLMNYCGYTLTKDHTKLKYKTPDSPSYICLFLLKDKRFISAEEGNCWKERMGTSETERLNRIFRREYAEYVKEMRDYTILFTPDEYIYVNHLKKIKEKLSLELIEQFKKVDKTKTEYWNKKMSGKELLDDNIKNVTSEWDYWHAKELAKDKKNKQLF